MRPLFLFGTLRHRPLLDALTGGLGGAGLREAALPGFRVVREAGTEIPMLVEHAEGSAHGLLVEGLPDDARSRLDLYELPFGYRPIPVTVRAGDEAVEAEAYLAPEHQEPSDEDWDLGTWVRDHAAWAVARAAELAAHEPPLDPGAFARQAGMIGHRASARLRAQGTPTAIRHRAAPGDFALSRDAPLAGAFFKLDRLRVAHRRFDGGRAEGLLREVMVGADAALVLPYDRARDRVLLVEQFRAGPARRGDPQPWILEPVAGLVDAFEAPEGAARREAAEEAGLHLAPGDLVPMFRGYASPGNATDHFFAYLALCDLPDGFATSGGLEEEQEDLRLHLLAAEEAIGLIGTGEANAMPLIAMLLWLDRWRRGASLDTGGGHP